MNVEEYTGCHYVMRDNNSIDSAECNLSPKTCIPNISGEEFLNTPHHPANETDLDLNLDISHAEAVKSSIGDVFMDNKNSTVSVLENTSVDQSEPENYTKKYSSNNTSIVLSNLSDFLAESDIAQEVDVNIMSDLFVTENIGRALTASPTDDNSVDGSPITCPTEGATHFSADSVEVSHDTLSSVTSDPVIEMMNPVTPSPLKLDTSHDLLPNASTPAVITSTCGSEQPMDTNEINSQTKDYRLPQHINVDTAELTGQDSSSFISDSSHTISGSGCHLEAMLTDNTNQFLSPIIPFMSASEAPSFMKRIEGAQGRKNSADVYNEGGAPHELTTSSTAAFYSLCQSQKSSVSDIFADSTASTNTASTNISLDFSALGKGMEDSEMSFDVCAPIPLPTASTEQAPLVFNLSKIPPQTSAIQEKILKKKKTQIIMDDISDVSLGGNTHDDKLTDNINQKQQTDTAVPSDLSGSNEDDDDDQINNTAEINEKECVAEDISDTDEKEIVFSEKQILDNSDTEEDEVVFSEKEISEDSMDSGCRNIDDNYTSPQSLEEPASQDENEGYSDESPSDDDDDCLCEEDSEGDSGLVWQGLQVDDEIR